jgi:zinc transporter 13
VTGELHRAPSNGQEFAKRNTPTKAEHQNFDTSSPDGYTDMFMDDVKMLENWADGPSENLWFLSLLSAGFVGLSGIFPLLVIPLEAGNVLRHGGKKTQTENEIIKNF